MMSYEEKRIYKATVLEMFAREGFLRRAHLAAEKLLATDDIEEITAIVESLLLDREALKEAEQDLAYAKEHFVGKEVDNHGKN